MGLAGGEWVSILLDYRTKRGGQGPSAVKGAKETQTGGKDRRSHGPSPRSRCGGLRGFSGHVVGIAGDGLKQGGINLFRDWRRQQGYLIANWGEISSRVSMSADTRVVCVRVRVPRGVASRPRLGSRITDYNLVSATGGGDERKSAKAKLALAAAQLTRLVS